ncbi:MAG: hypothetical protein ACHQ0Y_10520 [Thermodesulfovibrionales bacterium]
MKTHLRMTIICMVCMGAFLWCLGSAEAGQADWKVLQQSTYGDTLSYDAASVKHTESNTITVWAKTQSSEYLYEIDCKNKKARFLEAAGAAGSEWFTITGGGDELLYKAVCP